MNSYVGKGHEKSSLGMNNGVGMILQEGKKQSGDQHATLKCLPYYIKGWSHIGTMSTPFVCASQHYDYT